MIKFDNEKVDNPPPTYDDDVVLLEGDRKGYSQEQGFHGNDERTQFSMTRSAPDTLTYNTLINIAARCGKPEKAEEILNHMNDRLHSSLLPKEVKEKRFQPNVIAYSSIIDCIYPRPFARKGHQQLEYPLERK